MSLNRCCERKKSKKPVLPDLSPTLYVEKYMSNKWLNRMLGNKELHRVWKLLLSKKSYSTVDALDNGYEAQLPLDRNPGSATSKNIRKKTFLQCSIIETLTLYAKKENASNFWKLLQCNIKKFAGLLLFSSKKPILTGFYLIQNSYTLYEIISIHPG